jgi:putative ATP-dependent endonuclease of OLD family
MWSDKLSLEERAFQDLPWASVLVSVKLAQGLGFPVNDQVRSKFLEELEKDVDTWEDILDADALDAKELYVAMTRGSKSLTIIGTGRYLPTR